VKRLPSGRGVRHPFKQRQKKNNSNRKKQTDDLNSGHEKKHSVPLSGGLYSAAAKD
jgi:hypothetical protein